MNKEDCHHRTEYAVMIKTTVSAHSEKEAEHLIYDKMLFDEFSIEVEEI